MLFSSPVFLFGFLTAVLFLYYVILRKTKTRNVFLFIVSIMFYAWGEPKFVAIMCLSILVNYILGILIDKYRNEKIKARIIIACTLLYNLSVIFVFKYLMFVLTNVKLLTGLNFVIPVINLPIGISFFTFQAISYVIDIYRNNGKAHKNIFNVGLYIAFFPQLIAGPIVRYETISNQIINRKENIEDFSKGCVRFLAGFIKKVLISNQMAIIADAIFGATVPTSFLTAWLGAISYTFQIYYDFSGYSDMAIGLGKMFGFHFEENFNFPYISKSITEFWRRWHISLGTWFRDYVYIPLGGSRVGKVRLIFNLFIVWILTGVWHGASWNFVVWGLYFFVLLVFEKFVLNGRIKSEKLDKVLSNTLGRIYTISMVVFGWVLFRSPTLTYAVDYLKVMFTCNKDLLADALFLRYVFDKKVFLLGALIFSMPVCKLVNIWIDKLHSTKLKGIGYIAYIAYPVVYFALFLVSVAYLLKGTYNPFIYFNF